MDENLRHQRDTSIGQLDALIRRGLQIRATPSADANEIVDRILDVLMQGANCSDPTVSCGPMRRSPSATPGLPARCFAS
jgi:hypothetical protein